MERVDVVDVVIVGVAIRGGGSEERLGAVVTAVMAAVAGALCGGNIGGLELKGCCN